MPKPYVGEIVKYTHSDDKLRMRGPLAAIVVCVVAETMVNLAGWDRVGAPWTKENVPLKGTSPAPYCYEPAAPEPEPT